MALNYVDYDVLNSGVTTYRNQANELRNLISALDNMNGELQNGWKNDTATAFIERFNSDHKPKLQTAADAIEEISDYIQRYLNSRQDEDSKNAGAIRG